MDWKQRLLNKALGVLQDSRVSKLMQDPRVMSGVLGALKLRGQVQRNLDAGAARVAKSLHLASAAELRELSRAVARLEREFERARLARREAPGDRTLS